MAEWTLKLLAEDVRGKTLRLLEGVTDQQARWTPAGLNNSILWHAGHSLVVVESLGLERTIGAARAYPADWFEKFSWESKPATVKNWPPLAEVVALLKSQLGRLLAAIESLDEAKLVENIGTAEKPRTRRWMIMHGLHDEAGHQGEIWLLKKMLNKVPQ
jgi:DinB superfamily